MRRGGRWVARLADHYFIICRQLKPKTMNVRASIQISLAIYFACIGDSEMNYYNRFLVHFIIEVLRTIGRWKVVCVCVFCVVSLMSTAFHAKHFIKLKLTTLLLLLDECMHRLFGEKKCVANAKVSPNASQRSFYQCIAHVVVFEQFEIYCARTFCFSFFFWFVADVNER